MSVWPSRLAHFWRSPGAGLAIPALAQGDGAYPVRQLLLVVPYPAGGAVDLAARLVAGEDASGIRTDSRRREPARSQWYGRRCGGRSALSPTAIRF